MTVFSPRWSRGLAVALCLAFAGAIAMAQDVSGQQLEASGDSVLLSSLWLQSEETVSEETTVTVTETEESKCPATLDVTYSLYSDYVWRGMNLSEYAGEGREKPNHQLSVDLGIDIGKWVGEEPGTCGTFTFSTFFEWFAAQKKLNPIGGGQNLQRVDYTLAWSYEIDPWYSTFTLGYEFYTYPNVKAANTQEWFARLDHNDAWMWKWLWPENEDGVLNPTFLFAQDIDQSGGDAMWMEFGLSHEFELCPDLTLTPSWVLGVDHNYYYNVAGQAEQNTLRLANMLWGLDVTYDMTELLRIPEGWGGVALSGFLYFSDALGNAEDSGMIQDEFFGGMSIGWSF